MNQRSWWLRAGVLTFALATQCNAQSVFHVNHAAAPGGDGLTWATAFSDLQDALSAATLGSGINEIWVASGTYMPDQGTGNVSMAFTMRSGLRVLGGFVGTETSRGQRNARNNPTILSGSLASGGHALHVVDADLANATALLDGFVIKGGRALSSGIGGEGGGIRGEQCALTIASCIFSDNQATHGGAGFFYNSSPVMFNCTVAGNNGSFCAGVVFESDYTTTITPRVTNCTFTGNTAVNPVDAPALMSATLNGGCVIRNSVFWKNDFLTPKYNPAQFGGKVDVAYTCSSEAGSPSWPPVNFPTPNCLKGDPKLVNAAGPDGVYGTSDDDLRLQAGSQCIDSGDADSYPADAFDLDDDSDTSEPWPIDLENGARLYDDPNTPDTGGGVLPYADMGAFEGPALAVVLSAPSFVVPEGSWVPIGVALTRPPAASVTVNVGVTGDTDLSASPTSLGFDATNWVSLRRSMRPLRKIPTRSRARRMRLSPPWIASPPWRFSTRARTIRRRM